jgi:phosphate transport system substrate-binding protein
MKKIILISLVILVMSSICLSAAEKLSGTLNLSGAWALYPLAVKWGEEFKKVNPDVTLNISAGGAGKGMADVLSGMVDIGMVSREVDASEKDKGASPVFVAKDAVFGTISSKNPYLKQILAKGLSKETLGSIYITGDYTSWKQAVSGVDAPIHIYTRSDSCGAASAWAATIGKFKQENLKGVGIFGDPGLLEQVKRDPLAIGYNNLGFVFKGEKVIQGIVLVPIDANNNGKVDSDEKITTRDKAYKLVAEGKYPGSRKEYFVTKGKPSKLANAFIKYCLSAKGTKVLDQVGGYVPVSKCK